MDIDINAYNRATWGIETITVYGDSIHDMIINGYNNGYEVNKLNLLAALLPQTQLNGYDLVLDNSQFIYFAPITDIKQTLPILLGRASDTDHLCELLRRYDTKYQG
jgi:hypothetical protein